MSKASNSPLASIISHAARTVATPTGLDGGLQFIVNSSPIVAALLLKLAQKRAQHPALQKVSGDGSRLVELAAGVVRAGGSVAEARVVMRTFGLIPMLDWLLRIHPNPLKALANFFLRPSLNNLDIRNEKVFQTVRVILLTVFYLGEHAVWLGTKGILRLTPDQLALAGKLSIRFWAVDVFLSACKLGSTYRALNARAAALQTTGEVGEVDGYSLTDKKDGEEATKLAADFKAWKSAAWVNFGWLPLTAHWASGGLWTNPLITAILGTNVAIGKLSATWANTA